MAEGRSLSVIAGEIRKHWNHGGVKNAVHPTAKPYVDAMSTMRSVDENYYSDSGRSIVNYFIANAATFRGPEARRLKAELNRLLA